MPVEIDRKPRREEIIVKPSPVFELSAAFHALSVPGHHGFLSEWIRVTNSTLSDDEKRFLGLTASCSSQGLELCSCVFDIGEYDDCTAFMEKFNGYNTVDFLYTFLEENISREKNQILLIP